jgi:RHS repeat-associated protein
VLSELDPSRTLRMARRGLRLLTVAISLAEIVSFRSRLGYRGELTFDSLLYLRNRNDQPSTGQFTSRDPIDGTPGTTGVANPYHYVNNSPLMLIDPSGLFAVEDSMFAQLREAFNDPSWDHAGPNAYGTGVLGTFMNCLDDHNSTSACLNVVANPLYGTVASFGNCLDGGSSAYQCANQGFNPAYQLLVHGDRCITGETVLTGSMSRTTACGLAVIDTANTVATAVGGAKFATNATAAFEARGITQAEPLSATNTPDDLLGQARGARDELAAEVGKAKPTVTGGYDPATGRVVAGCSSNPVGCAEDDVVRKLGIGEKDARFTEAVRPRTGQEVPICVRCQAKFDPGQFPPGTKFDAGGAWGG